MDYRTVFEVVDKGFDIIKLIPLLIAFLGIGSSLYYILYDKKESSKIAGGFIIGGFALLILIPTLYVTFEERKRIQELFYNQNYEVVEGKIENFHPMPYKGNAAESFTVNGVYFKYSDYVLIYGFNNSASHGGPLKRNGQYVRLSYIKEKGDNRILKIELKE